MLPVLRAIKGHPGLNLQLLATGMHLSPAHGDTLASLASEGFPPDRVVDWPPTNVPTPTTTAIHTGRAIAEMAQALADFKTDIALVAGDRVEAFAGATAAHISNIAVAHVHGGDRAAGQVDDSLRHAITKLAHIHFPATRKSAERIYRLGEDRWCIIRAGSPGLDGIVRAAASRSETTKAVGGLTRGKFALVLLHPADADDEVEFNRADLVLDATMSVPFEQIVMVCPNNDPGSAGIMRCWNEIDVQDNSRRIRRHRDLGRPVFLSLLRDCTALIGNSSSGIIEAASFGTPVIDIGYRQNGRERSANVTNVPYHKGRLLSALTRIWNKGRPRRFKPDNVYSGKDAARTIANALATVSLDERLLHKLIRY
jgi:UDP-N-acetylglucosamine 2-epimerase (non-hydrolysing)/GDP/UDP-N,N'-diacetylbacillosamine 2-epimerase (hydrolysing)